jgi:hypothetical protein
VATASHRSCRRSKMCRFTRGSTAGAVDAVDAVDAEGRGAGQRPSPCLIYVRERCNPSDLSSAGPCSGLARRGGCWPSSLVAVLRTAVPEGGSCYGRLDDGDPHRHGHAAAG